MVVGSLTKLLACPGLRLGYVLADPDLVARCRARQPAWSVGGLAAAALPELLEAADLPGWCAGVAQLRGALTDLLASHGLPVRPSDANWVLVDRGGLREALAPHGVVVRDCASFGLPGVTRIAVPSEEGLERLAAALAAAAIRGARRMSWRRPVPLVGDASSARARREAPRAWAFGEQERDAFYAAVLGRRDIRRFRPDDIEPDVLERILGAAHAAPSVGHSQPWRFVVVRDAATRDRAALDGRPGVAPPGGEPGRSFRAPDARPAAARHPRRAGRHRGLLRPAHGGAGRARARHLRRRRPVVVRVRHREPVAGGARRGRRRRMGDAVPARASSPR